MKKYLIAPPLLISILFFSTHSFSQGLAVNTDASTADPSAMLDVKAANKGILIPRIASTSAITSPVTGLLVYQTSLPAGFYYYNGTAWLLLQNTSGTVATLTTPRNINGVAFDGSQDITIPSAGAAGGSLSGTYPDPGIAPGAVTTTEILDGTITGSDISATAAIPYGALSLNNSIRNGDITANAITTSKVAAGTVTTSKMADSAISGLKLLTGAVTPRHINTTGAIAGQAMIFDGTNVNWATPVSSATGAAGGSLSGTYPNPAIAADAVTTTEILDGTITGSDVSATAAIPYISLSLNNSIQNGDITANAITTSKVANGTVTTSKMADSAISGLKLLTAAVTPKHINTTGASAGQAMIFDGANVNWASPTGAPVGAAGGSLSGIYPNPTIAAGAVTTTEILDGTITGSDVSATAAISYGSLSLNNSIQNGDITANAITTSKVANGTVTTSKMADSAISGLKLLTGAVTPKHINTTGASAGQALIFDGTNVNWTTPAGGGGFPAIITDATALTSITTTSSYQDMGSITLSSTGHYLITVFINITSQQTADEYHSRISQGGTILTGSVDYFASDGMMSLSTVVNITPGTLATPLVIQCNNFQNAEGNAVGTYSVVKLSD